MSDLYFAYGSNCHEPRMARRCPSAQVIGSGWVEDLRQSWVERSDGRVRATFRAGPGRRLEGVLWKDADRQALDRVEGEGVAYERVELDVHTSDGVRSAYTYRAIEGPQDGPGTPKTGVDASYAAIVSVGRASFGLATPDAHLVLVYGSLMEGFNNHDVLIRGAELAEPVGATTIWGFRMHDLGYFPGVVEARGSSVRCEAYVVDPWTLRRLDHLEGHPSHYMRQHVWTACGKQAWVYIYQRPVGHAVDVESGDWRHYTEHVKIGLVADRRTR